MVWIIWVEGRTAFNGHALYARSKTRADFMVYNLLRAGTVPVSVHHVKG